MVALRQDTVTPGHVQTHSRSVPIPKSLSQVSKTGNSPWKAEGLQMSAAKSPCGINQAGVGWKVSGIQSLPEHSPRRWSGELGL